MSDHRDAAADAAGIKIRNPADDKLYPVPGQGIKKRDTPGSLTLPIISVQHLTAAPSLKSWLDSREGKPIKADHAPVVEILKTAKANGAPINLNVTPEGFYDRAFSAANGNMVEIEDFHRLLQAGFSVGECLLVTKLVCGPNGVCGKTDSGRPGPCAICSDIRCGSYTSQVFVLPKAAEPQRLGSSDPIDEEIDLLVSEGKGYRILGSRLVNMENSKSAGLQEIRDLCSGTGRGVIYVLELLGVYRATEAESHTALKRIDVGGH